MRVGIHQPEYLPWLGFFNKIKQSDIYIILDTAQFSHGDFHNRNKIKTSQGPIWLTVPVKSDSRNSLNNIYIDNNKKWQHQHWQSIKQNYSKSAHFQEIKEILEDIYINKKFDKLIDLNLEINKRIINHLDLNTKLLLSSNLGPSGKKTDLLIDICNKVKGDVYLSGAGSKNYIDENKFKNAKIKLEYQNFIHPAYNQRFKEFLPYMSIIDCISNIGSKEALKLI